jgi:hypothetical protein
MNQGGCHRSMGQQGTRCESTSAADGSQVFWEEGQRVKGRKERRIEADTKDSGARP